MSGLMCSDQLLTYSLQCPQEEIFIQEQMIRDGSLGWSSMTLLLIAGSQIHFHHFCLDILIAHSITCDLIQWTFIYALEMLVNIMGESKCWCECGHYRDHVGTTESILESI
jgi:hypothetical protein